MTKTITNPAVSSSDLREQIDMFFAEVGQGFNAYLLRRSRADEIQKLNALSDTELAEKGLTRDRIAHHVFGQMIYM